jgi:hypothetical protein
VGSPGPHWVRLVRLGNVFAAYVRRDGDSTWKAVKELSLTLDSSVYVGLAVTAHNDAKLATATFDHVSVRNGPVSPTPIPAN